MNGYSTYVTPHSKKSGYLSPRRIQSPTRALSPRCSSPRQGHISSPMPQRVCSPNRSLYIRPNSILKSTSSQFKPAYKRISSDRSIKLIMLPGFIRMQESEIQKYSSSISLSRTRITEAQNESRVLRPTRANGECIRNKASFNNDVLRLVFDKTQSNDEVLLTFGKYSLTRGNLSCLYPEKELNDLLIDSCLKCVKYKNFRMVKKGKTKNRICCLSTKFCKFLAQRGLGLPPRNKRNLLEYDVVVFPIFVGYWTVLVLNTRTKCARYFDPIGIEKKDDVIFDQLLALLKREIKFRENKSIENTRWMRLEFDRVSECEGFSSCDSGVYVVRQALKVASCKDIKIVPEVMTEFRSSLLLHLFKYGNKITY